MDLLTKIKRASEAYYLDEPIMSDEEYDSLVLQAEKEGLLTRDIILNDGANIKGNIQHIRPMLSLAKANTIEELKSFLQSINKKTNQDNLFYVEPKYDGLALSIRFKNGQPYLSCTRGNGLYGEDVSYILNHEELTIFNLPINIDSNIQELRGELICFKEDLQFNNQSRGQDFKNERAAVSGILKKAKLGLGYKAKLTFVAYDIYPENCKFVNNLDIDFYKEFFRADGELESILKVCQSLKDGYTFPTDGIVIKMVNPIDLGNTAHHPLNQVAYKFKDLTNETTLLDVKWQLGKSGRYSPIGVVEPVFVSGTTIKNISLNNIDWIERNNLTIGAKVLVKRANDVIPNIDKVLTITEKQILSPTTCSHCGHELIREDKFIYCQNDYCKEKLIQKVIDYASKKCLDIEGMSDSLIRALELTSFKQLALLEKEDLDITYKSGVKLGIRADSILEQIKNLKIEEYKALYIILSEAGVDGFGYETCKLLLREYKSITNLLITDLNRLFSVKGIGSVLAKNLFSKLRLANKIYDDVSDCVKIKSERLQNKGSFCITGKPPEPYKNREEFVRAMEEKGYVFHSSIKKDTNYLVCENTLGNSSKLKKARDLGVKLVSILE